MPENTSLFTQHSRLWRDHLYVYPVISRRSAGLSLGINLTPNKACAFDCLYCSVDRTFPGIIASVDMSIVAAELNALLEQITSGELFASPPFCSTPASLRHLADVAFSGDGEPTASPQFAPAIEVVADALRRHRLGDTRIVVITNATQLDQPRVIAALNRLDQLPVDLWVKLDAGTEEHYRLINRCALPFSRILSNILATGRRRPIIIQSMFVRWQGQAPSEAEISAYLRRLDELVEGGCRIRLVQVYTSARKTAAALITPLEDESLRKIASGVRSLGLTAEIFGNVKPSAPL